MIGGRGARLRAAGAACALLASACGGGDGGSEEVQAVVDELIDTGGGSITSSDGRLTLEFPAGALPAENTITIETLDPDQLPSEFDGIPVDFAFDLRPDGLTFDEPVAVTFQAGAVEEEADGTLSLGRLPILLTNAKGAVAAVDDLALKEDFGSGDLQASGTLEHFSVLGIMSNPIVQTLDGNPSTEVRVVGVPDKVEVGSQVQITVSVVQSTDSNLAVDFVLVNAANVGLFHPSTTVMENIGELKLGQAQTLTSTTQWECSAEGVGKFQVGLHLGLIDIVGDPTDPRAPDDPFTTIPEAGASIEKPVECVESGSSTSGQLTITVPSRHNLPAWAAIQTGGQTWQPVQLQAGTNTFDVENDGFFEFAYVCNFRDKEDRGRLFRTNVAAVPELALDCAAESSKTDVNGTIQFDADSVQIAAANFTPVIQAFESPHPYSLEVTTDLDPSGEPALATIDSTGDFQSDCAKKIIFEPTIELPPLGDSCGSTTTFTVDTDVTSRSSYSGTVAEILDAGNQIQVGLCSISAATLPDPPEFDCPVPADDVFDSLVAVNRWFDSASFTHLVAGQCMGDNPPASVNVTVNPDFSERSERITGSEGIHILRVNAWDPTGGTDPEMEEFGVVVRVREPAVFDFEWSVFDTRNSEVTIPFEELETTSGYNPAWSIALADAVMDVYRVATTGDFKEGFRIGENNVYEVLDVFPRTPRCDPGEAYTIQVEVDVPPP